MPTVGTWMSDDLSVRFKIKALALGKTPSKLIKLMIEDFLFKDKNLVVAEDAEIELIKLKKEKNNILKNIGINVNQITAHANTRKTIDMSMLIKIDEIKIILEELKNDSKNI